MGVGADIEDRRGPTQAGIGWGLIAAFGLAGCGSEGDELARQYALLEANRAGTAELCDHSRRTARAYLDSGDEAKLAEWKRREAKDCAAPAAVRTGPAAGPPPPPPRPATVTIAGKLSYPSDRLPEDLTVCAQEVDSGKIHCGAEAGMERSDSAYTLRLAPGRYRVWARTKEMADAKAYYSQFVVCGLAVECKSHEPIIVDVAAGATRKAVDPGDWYDY